MDEVVVTIEKPVPTSVLDARVQSLMQAAEEAGDDEEARESLAKAARDAAAETTETIKVTMRTATRRQAGRRGAHRRILREWIMAKCGVEKAEDIPWTSLDPEVEELWIPMWQSADILGAMVPDSSEGWEPPSDPEGWADVKDYIFTALLQEAWALNPHWRNEALQLVGNA